MILLKFWTSEINVLINVADCKTLVVDYSYRLRQHIAHDAEERQQFYDRIIVLLLTVDAIEVS